MAPVPTMYLREKHDNIERMITLLEGGQANDWLVLTDIIHNANSITLEAKKWRTHRKETIDG